MTQLVTNQYFHAWYFDWDEDAYLSLARTRATLQRLQTNIVQGLFPQKKFPVINELYDEQLLYRKRKNPRLNSSRTMAHRSAYEQLKTNFENRAYNSMYQNHIMKIVDILDSLASRVPESPTQWDKGVYTQGKIYLEFGKDEHTFSSRVEDLQFELLFITHEEFNDEMNQPNMRISGVSFNPNKFQPNYAAQYPWDIYTSVTLEENCANLQQVYELTYEVYVELVNQLNYPFNISLNYPGGIL